MSGYVPALRFHLLTRFYDPLVRVFFHEVPRKLRLVAMGPPASGSASRVPARRAAALAA